MTAVISVDERRREPNVAVLKAPVGDSREWLATPSFGSSVLGRRGIRRDVISEDEVVEALRWHNDPVTESDRWNLASGDEFIREGSRDAKHRRRFADGHRQPI